LLIEFVQLLNLAVIQFGALQFLFKLVAKLGDGDLEELCFSVLFYPSYHFVGFTIDQGLLIHVYQLILSYPFFQSLDGNGAVVQLDF